MYRNNYGLHLFQPRLQLLVA